MQFELKFKSIAARWFINIFLLVAIVISVAAIAFSALCNAIYVERIEALANDYAYEFYALSGTDKLTYKDAAIEIAGNFQYKDKIEVQVIDANVFAYMHDFEVTDDITMNIEPSVIAPDNVYAMHTSTHLGQNAVGLRLGIRF